MAGNAIDATWHGVQQRPERLRDGRHGGEVLEARVIAESVSETQRAWSTFVHLSIAVFMVAACAGASAQVASTPPSHTHAGSDASAWECERGFQRGFDKSEEACIAVRVPPNAYLDASGSDWECDRGYVKSEQSCTAVKVPLNAHSSDELFSNGWECDRGFRGQQKRCIPVIVPPHAYLVNDSYGPGWRCERGYRVSETTCAAITAPTHAFLTDSGDDWECERGFNRQRDACAAVAVPDNGLLDAPGARLDLWARIPTAGIQVCGAERPDTRIHRLFRKRLDLRGWVSPAGRRL
jgi:hypothetical protein